MQFLIHFRPKIVDAQLTGSRTSIQLKWTVPEDARRTQWAYAVFYGSNMEDIYQQENRKSVAQPGVTSETVEGLDSCESYTFGVAVVGPSGIGRLSPPVTRETKYSPGAPPKGVRVKVEGADMTVTWNASCSKVGRNLLPTFKFTVCTVFT